MIEFIVWLVAANLIGVCVWAAVCYAFNER